MRITTFAGQLGVSPDWLRKLERQGRIPSPSRDVNGHRRYHERDIQCLRQILFGAQRPSSSARGAVKHSGRNTGDNRTTRGDRS